LLSACRCLALWLLAGMIAAMTQNAGVAAAARWADQISLGVLASAVPRDVIDDVVAACGRQVAEQLGNQIGGDLIFGAGHRSNRSRELPVRHG
jgi:hypothetical protein